MNILCPGELRKPSISASRHGDCRHLPRAQLPAGLGGEERVLEQRFRGQVPETEDSLATATSKVSQFHWSHGTCEMFERKLSVAANMKHICQ